MAILIRLAAIIAALVVAAAAPAAANDGLHLVEQQIKAGLLYNFLKYTDWPPGAMSGAKGDTVVCLLGGDPFGGHLDPMAGRTVNQKKIVIRKIGSVDEADACSMLVIHGDEKADWPTLRAALQGKGILTVSDFDGFAESGGMIGFTRHDNRIGVTVNTDAVAAAHLRVEDRLLKLASVVHTGPTGN